MRGMKPKFGPALAPDYEGEGERNGNCLVIKRGGAKTELTNGGCNG